MKLFSTLKCFFVKSHIILVSGLATVVVFSVCIPRILNTQSIVTEDIAKHWGIDKNAVSGGLEGKTREELQEEANKKLLDGMMNISMNLRPVFADGESEGNLLIVNEEINNYPQVIQIFNDDTGEMIYESGLIPVGSKVENAKLNVNLVEGEYPCTAYFHSVNENSGKFIGTAGAKITLIIEK